ncbi:MAG: hypothetical protein IT204_14525 [Fimbriimonadaceae bacterium]|nr:hypothetical protein [Fimbriimonadaceae bacterium]
MRRSGWGALLALLVLRPAMAVTPPGLVFEAEAVCEPTTAWQLNRDSGDRWKLWTTEEEIAKKRSGEAVLASPTVSADRATPEAGAPPLHARVPLPAGIYRAWISAPGRPLAYSRNGRDWTRYEGGECDLGLVEVGAAGFELWVDDRFAHPPGNPGPGYFDYLRFQALPRGAEQFQRAVPWASFPGQSGPAVRRLLPADWRLTQFETEGSTLRTGAAGATAEHTVRTAGQAWLAIQMIDDADGTEQLEVQLNGRALGVAVGEQNTDQLACFLLRPPLDLRVGDKLTLRTQTAVGMYRIAQVVLAPQPITPPAAALGDLAAWSPRPGEVHLCWTSTVALETGQAELRRGEQVLRQELRGNRARNHRLIFRGLPPGVSCTATVRSGDLTAGPLELSTSPLVSARPTTPASVELTVSEPTSQPRRGWATTVGVPFARGALQQTADLAVRDAAGQVRGRGGEVVSRWPDGSLKWVAVTFAADTSVGQPTAYRLVAQPAGAAAEAWLRVTESAAAWQVDAGGLAFELGKQVPALFSKLAADRNRDGALTPDEQIAATPLGANVRLENGDQVNFTLGPPSTLDVERLAPDRAVIRFAGRLRSAGTEPGWGYLVRLTLWPRQPQMAVNLSLLNDEPAPRFRAIRALALRVPLEAVGGVKGSLDGGPLVAVPDAEGLWAQQDQDNLYRRRGAGGEERGQQGVGVAVAQDDRWRVSVAMKDFVEAYPSGFAVKPDGVHVRLLPWLPANAYADEADPQTWLRLYSWCRDGQYLLKAGQLVQKEILVRWDDPAQAADPVAWARWYQQPAVPAAAPAYACGTAVLGRAVFPRTAGTWDRYETYLDRGFADFTKDRQTQRSYGYQHFGDWFGERIFNYGNNEYDLPWALGVQYLRTGDARYWDRGEEMARHHSTIDTAWGEFTNNWNGLVYEHSFNHIGADLKLDDPRLQAPLVASYLKQFGTGMFGGAIDRQGHVFQPGNWIAGAISGDPWYLEAAARVCDNQAEKLTPNYDFGIERAGGWPLINMSLAYAFSSNPYYLNAARLMIERTLGRQDPVTGGWLHRPPLDETDGEEVMGGKAFAVGILTHGILRYLEQEPQPRPEVRRMLVRGADWLMNESWNPGRGFRYISNARAYRDTGGKGVTSLLNVEPVVFAFEETKDARYLHFAQEMIAGQLDSSPGGMGKSYAMAVRQTVFGLDRLRLAGVTDAAAPPKVVVRDRLWARDGQAELRVLLVNPGLQPVAASARVSAGGTAVPVEWQAPPGGAVSPPLRIRLTGGDLVVEAALAGGPSLRQRVRLVTPPAGTARGQGVAYVGPTEHPTRRGLRAAGLDLPWVEQPATAELGRYAGLIVAGDAWKSAQIDLPAAADALAAFAARGGRVAVFQLNDDSWQPGWLPDDLFADDADTTLQSVGAHPLFSQPHRLPALTGAKSYDSLSVAGPGWTVLAKDAAGRPAVVEAVVGAGRIVVIEPSLDRYAAGEADAPDGAVTTAAARDFLRNLADYLAR